MACWINRSAPPSHHLSDLDEENEKSPHFSEDTLDEISTDSLDCVQLNNNKVTASEERMKSVGGFDKGVKSYDKTVQTLNDLHCNWDFPIRSSSISRSSQLCWKNKWSVPLCMGPVPRSSVVRAQRKSLVQRRMVTNRQTPMKVPLVKLQAESYRFLFGRKFRRPVSPSSSAFCEAPSSHSDFSPNASLKTQSTSTSWMCAGIKSENRSNLSSAKSSSMHRSTSIRKVHHFSPLAPMSASLGPNYVPPEKLKLVLQQQLFANDVRRRHLHARRSAAATSEARVSVAQASAPRLSVREIPMPRQHLQKVSQRRFKILTHPKKSEDATCKLPLDLGQLESRLLQLQLQHQSDVRLAEKVHSELTNCCEQHATISLT